MTGWTRLLLAGLPWPVLYGNCTAHNIFRSTITEGFATSSDKSELCNVPIVELVEEYDTVFEILHCLYPDISTQDGKAIGHKINTQAKRLLLWDTKYRCILSLY